MGILLWGLGIRGGVVGRGSLGDIVHRGVEIVLGHHAKIGGLEAMNLKSNV